MQLCRVAGCFEAAYPPIPYYCQQHDKGAYRVNNMKCRVCARYSPSAKFSPHTAWVCEACAISQKRKELRDVAEQAEFLQELDCPREVLIDLVGSVAGGSFGDRWNIEQDCIRLNLPDEK